MRIDESKEYWTPIDGWQSYEVSTKGRVRHQYKDGAYRNMAIRRDSKGNSVTLCEGNRKYHARVRRLVAEAYLENPSNSKYVKYLDGNRFNDALTNLAWGEWSDRQLRPRTRMKRMICVFTADTGQLYRLYAAYQDDCQDLGISEASLYRHLASGKPFGGYIFKKLHLGADGRFTAKSRIKTK